MRSFYVPEPTPPQVEQGKKLRGMEQEMIKKSPLLSLLCNWVPDNMCMGEHPETQPEMRNVTPRTELLEDKR